MHQQNNLYSNHIQNAKAYRKLLIIFQNLKAYQKYIETKTWLALLFLQHNIITRNYYVNRKSRYL